MDPLEKKYQILAPNLTEDEKVKWALIEAEEKGIESLPLIASIFQIKEDVFQKNLADTLNYQDLKLYDSMPDEIKEALNSLGTEEAQKEEAIPDIVTFYEFYKDLEDQVKVRTEVIAQKKKEAEDLSVKMSGFLSSMSHELRTPLHAILAYSDLGKNRAKEDKLVAYFEKIQKSGNRLIELINNLLELSKLESGSATFNFTEFNLKDLISECCDELAPLFEKKKINFSINFQSEDYFIEADNAKIHQIMTNLLSNALKFTPEGKNISITISTAFDSERPLSFHISVEDEGEGIPETKLDLIFDKFSQSKEDHNKTGTGLGLSIVREIVQKHDGKVWAENRKEGGARLTVLLPQKQKR